MVGENSFHQTFNAVYYVDLLPTKVTYVDSFIKFSQVNNYRN